MTSRFVARVVAAGLVMLAGCRACGDEPSGAAPARSTSTSNDEARRQPPMPAGMLGAASASASPSPLASSDAGSLAAPPVGGEALKMARGVKGGAWTELQPASEGDTPSRVAFEHWRADSRFVSLEAMTLLHGAFARALPGFDLFLPRLYAPDALARLATELSSFESEWASTSTLSAAKAKWADTSTLVRDLPDDEAWSAARATLVVTMRELAAFARELAKEGRSLWVLGA